MTMLHDWRQNRKEHKDFKYSNAFNSAVYSATLFVEKPMYPHEKYTSTFPFTWEKPKAAFPGFGSAAPSKNIVSIFYSKIIISRRVERDAGSSISDATVSHF